ncbi:D-isomer specific 2-hydroxyacid dehydrogenase NAD-binding protein [Halococcus salifodinae DSM 8989]|uniref:D-isomer specific 2-hydroxyacid dehydrogenase NAD-binding protein n=2 Tax=Halococcus salifodinae TaxID=36738 RepID=M0N8K8_9EURY|nr:D-isomer specific 2-hydroxyacid dehydrogenase NAD-binding protein [Halococcus salifodinae DSM 8989]
MYEALEGLEERGVAFDRMDWMGDASPAEFRNVTMDMESAGPGSYDTGAIAAELDGVDALVVHKAPVSRELIDGADSLELVGAARGGTENVDVEAAADNGVTVLHAPGRNRDAVADYAVSMLLSRLREIPFNHAELSAGEWNQVFDPDRLPPDVRTTTVGVVGFGHIGRGVARRLAGFDPEILAYDPFVDDDEIREAGPEPADLETLLAESDAVTLHVRLSRDTEGMMGREEFQRMKPSAYLINTARGGLVDEEALVAALENDELGGAAIDVFQEEPLPVDHPLFDRDEVVLTPHVAGSTRDAVLGGPRIIAGQLDDYLDGETPEHVVE